MKVKNKHFLLVIIISLLAVACSDGTRSDDDIAAAENRPAGVSNNPGAQPTEELEPTPEPTQVVAEPGAIGLGDPYFPEEGNSGYDVQHYDIELSADMEAQHIDSVVSIEAMASDNLSAFNLDFEQFEITELLVNSEPAVFRQLGDELTIIPTESLLKDENFSVQIAYSGRPSPSTDDGDAIPTGWYWQNNASFVASEPFGAQA